MEKILTIDGRQVKFKSTGAFLLRYKAQFRCDPLKDIYKLKDCLGPEGEIVNLETFDLELFYNLIWTLAKTADPQIPPPMEWLDEFNEFPLMEILPEIQDMLFSAMGATAESKKK